MGNRLVTALLTLAGLFGVALAAAPAAHAESSPSAFGAKLVSLINAARSQHGLHSLTVASGTTTVAQGWSYHLAKQQALSHNPDLATELETHGSRDWTAYGENVGAAPTTSAQALFDGYMNSPEHRANILGSAYRYIGVGVVFSGSYAWNTLDFVDEYSSGSTSASSTTTTQSATSAPRPTHRVNQAAPLTAPVFHRASVLSRPVRTAPRTPARPVQARTPLSRLVEVDATTSARPDTASGPLTAHAAMLPLPGHHRSPLPFVAALVTLLLAAVRFLVAIVHRSA